MDEKVAYLIKVNPNTNNNKFYRMIHIPGTNYFIVEYGRIGTTGMKRKYPLEQWYIKLNEKLNKGYSDQTSICTAPTIQLKNEFKPINETSVKNLIDRLRKWAKDTIKSEYTIKINDVNEKMVNEAQAFINNLYSASSLEVFNETLIRLFTVLPRKIDGRVADHLAKSNLDFTRIVEKEQNLLDIMKGQLHTCKIISQNLKESKKIPNITILEAMGLNIRPVTPKEELEIKTHLTAESQGRYKAAWKIVNEKTERAFQDYCKMQGIKHTQFLYHGSRNENFWNILCSGLSLNPNSHITGKMYGYGLYFANRAMKSINYTSIKGSFWAKGTETSGFLAVFKVAIGNPWDVYDWKPIYSSYKEKDIRKMGKDSTFAHSGAGNSLKNDEIIVYNEAACTIRYLIEIE